MKPGLEGMTVVSVRLGAEQEAFLKAHKLKPGPFAKAAVEKEIKRLQFREAVDHLANHPVKLDQPVTKLIREDRDRGH